MFSPNTANAMCCFGDPGRHLEVKVENRGREKKWAIPKFFLVTCAGCFLVQANGGLKATEPHLARDKWTEM